MLSVMQDGPLFAFNDASSSASVAPGIAAASALTSHAHRSHPPHAHHPGSPFASPGNAPSHGNDARSECLSPSTAALSASTTNGCQAVPDPPTIAASQQSDLETSFHEAAAGVERLAGSLDGQRLVVQHGLPRRSHRTRTQVHSFAGLQNL